MMRRALFLIILLCLAVSLVPSCKVPPKHYKLTELDDSRVGQSARVSPDGRYLSDEDEEAEGVWDLKSGKKHPTGSGLGPFTFSSEGKQIAWDWGNPLRDAPPPAFSSSSGALRRSEETTSMTFMPDIPRYNTALNAELLRSWFHDWSPDRKYVAATFMLKDLTYQLGLVSVSDGSVRVLKTQAFKTINHNFQRVEVRFSPDGRFLAYDLAPRGGWYPRDIFAVSFAGGPEIPLVENAANDLLFGWTPDGKSILFVSDRSGGWDLWTIKVVDGRPNGPPARVIQNFGVNWSAGFTRDGSYFYTVLARESDVYLTDLDPATSRLRTPEKLVSHTGWSTSVEWSRDGQSLAYASGDGFEYDPYVLGIRSVRTGKERQFRLDTLLRFGEHGFEPRWSPDGRFILVEARERDYPGPLIDTQGLYRIDVQTGSVSPLVRTSTAGCGRECLESQLWSPDGRVIFKRRRPERIVSLDVQTGQEKEIYRAVPPAEVFHWPTSNLAISPDGQRLAFVLLDRKAGTTTLKVIPAAGGEALELLRAHQSDDYVSTISLPAWMPDSRQIIYARNVAGQKRQFELWRVSAGGGEPQSLGLTMQGLEPYGLSVHPDGRRIAFTAGKPWHSEVWVLKDFLPELKTANSGVK